MSDDFQHDEVVAFVAARLVEDTEVVDAVRVAARRDNVWAVGWDAERVRRHDLVYSEFSHMINLYYQAKERDDPIHVPNPRHGPRPASAPGTFPAWELVMKMLANIWAYQPDFKESWRY